MRRSILLTALCALSLQPLLDACTTFCVRAGNRVLFGRNYDFEIGDGMVMVNAAGLEKRGYLQGGPAWRARHGSVTFNQFGRGFPMGGMNEAGLVVELMWLNDTKYPDADARAPLSVLEWIQYQLDTSATVADVIASDAKVRIQGRIPLHYLVSDKSGEVAAIEFLDGKMVGHAGNGLPVAVLANDTYASSLAFMREKKGLPGGPGSRERFTRAARMLPGVAASGDYAMARAFDVLADVKQRETRWSIVYDQSARAIQWRTDRHDGFRNVQFASLRFDCAAPPTALDVHAKVLGDATPHLTELTAERNHALIASSTKKTSFTRQTPAAEVQAQADYGFAVRCVR